jgi:hypothetical protein
MAAVTGAVIGGLALANNIYQGQQNRKAAANAAKTSQNAANAALGAQQTNYNNTAANLQPYVNAGTSALGDLNAVNSGNYAGFENSPDYLYALQQGLKGVDRSAASRGALYSGGTTADTLGTAEGLASQNLGNYRSSLMSLAQLGAGAGANLGSVGAGQAAAIGNIGFNNAANQTTAGYNAAAGNINTANNTAGILGQLWGQYGGSLSSGTPAANASSYSLSPTQNTFAGGTYTGPQSLATNATVPNYLTGA